MTNLSRCIVFCGIGDPANDSRKVRLIGRLNNGKGERERDVPPGLSLFDFLPRIENLLVHLQRHTSDEKKHLLRALAGSTHMQVFVDIYNDTHIRIARPFLFFSFDFSPLLDMTTMQVMIINR